MKLSARNQIAGMIRTVKPGATTTHVTIEVSPTVTITASITNEAAEELGLKAGMPAFAVIKASDVMVGVGLLRRGLGDAQRPQCRKK
jgi:molybdopterin-binding protein